MSNKHIKELRNMSPAELLVKVREAEKTLFDARMKRKTSQLEDINTIWKIRKNLARMKTLVGQQAKQALEVKTDGK